MNDVKGIISMISERLKKMAQSNAVVTQPVSFGDRHVLPMCELKLGFAGGGGTGEDKSGGEPSGGKGSGAGGAAKVRPVAAIVFTEEEVRVEKIPDKLGPLDKIFEKIPDLIDLAQKHKH